jgi:hypothetical protein
MASAHVWVVEVRDRDTSRPEGWTAWKPLYRHDHFEVYDVRADARRERDWLNGPSYSQYRVAPYDRREP